MPRKKLPKNDYPKISIVIPSFNKAKYIAQTLQSIIDQKYPNLEVFIQDGKSTDGTVEIIERFARKYKFIKWVSKKDNGQLDAIKKGLAKASGEILTYINADDIYKREAFKKVSEVFRNNQNVHWITGFGDIVNSQGEEISGIVTKYKNGLIRANNYQLLLMVNYLTQPATFISKKAYKMYGPFTGNKNWIMEYELWLKLGKVKMPEIIPDTLASFRLVDDSISATSFRKVLNIDNKIAKKYTKNKALLFLHNLHNVARIKIITQ